MAANDPNVDRQVWVYDRWDVQQRQRTRALISESLIEEHRAQPLGLHSDPLQRVLHYFRRQPVAGKYIAVMTKPWSEYKIGVLSGVRGEPPTVLDDEAYPSEETVLHAIFLRRVRDLMET
jgi:branched-chain amino acid transport system permease protein